MDVLRLIASQNNFIVKMKAIIYMYIMHLCFS